MILHGDCLERLKELPNNSAHSIVTDPPYGLSFMGKKWDYDVPSKLIWAEALRVLKPGSHLLSFGGTRTYHRMVVQIEDAGFEIRDQLQWIYGSGFPKSHNLPDGIGTALKPANEPIVMARKPFEGTVAKNFEKWGCGGLNIDVSRIDAKESLLRPLGKPLNGGAYGSDRNDRESLGVGGSTNGRWPANVIFDEEAAALLDEQSGTLKSGALNRANIKAENKTYGAAPKVRDGEYTADSGGASRFFYVAKASKKERGEGNVHPTVKPIKLMEYLIKLITPEGGIVLDPFCGSGSTGIAATRLGFGFIGIEREAEYIEIAKKRLEAV